MPWDGLSRLPVSFSLCLRLVRCCSCVSCVYVRTWVLYVLYVCALLVCVRTCGSCMRSISICVVCLCGVCGVQRTKRIEEEIQTQEGAQRAEVAKAKSETTRIQQQVCGNVHLHPCLCWSGYTQMLSLGRPSVWYFPLPLFFFSQLLSLTHNNTSLLRVIGDLTATQMKLERELNAQVCVCSVCVWMSAGGPCVALWL